MNLLEELNKELSLVYGEKDPLLEYKKWRRPKGSSKPTEDKSKQYLALQSNVSAAVQTYDKAIKQVMDTNPGQVLQDNKKAQLIALLDEFDEQLDKTSSESENLESDEEYNEINQSIEKTKESNNKAKEALKGKRVFKADVTNLLDYMESLLNAKLPKGAITALALSNPLTNIVYQNFDILKGAYHAVRNNRTNN